MFRRHRYRPWRTWELKEQLRDLYRTVDPADARAYLKRWCTSVKRSRIPAFANLVRRIETHFDAIIAAVELGLPNSRLEGINAKVRLIQRRGYGFRNLDSLTAAIYLCPDKITLNPPIERCGDVRMCGCSGVCGWIYLSVCAWRRYGLPGGSGVEQDRAVRVLVWYFAACPNWQVDGVDLFESPLSPAGLTCRVYPTSSGLAGVPEVDDLVAALTEKVTS